MTFFAARVRWKKLFALFAAIGQQRRVTDLKLAIAIDNRRRDTEISTMSANATASHSSLRDLTG